MKVSLGVSTATKGKEAIREALTFATRESGEPSFLFLFATLQYDPQELVESVRELMPSVKILGCVSEGVIGGPRLFVQGVVVCALSGEDIEVVTFSLRDDEKDSYELGKRAGEIVRASSPEAGTVILFPSPSLEVPLLLQGMYGVLGPRFLYLGGGTWRRFTEKYDGGECLSGAVFRNLDFSSRALHGWSPTKELLVVTKTRGKEVVEIDGIPPFEAYREKVGDFPREQLAQIGTLYPLGFPGIHGEFLIRDPAYVAPDGAMGFVGASIPQGAVGYIMKGEKENLLAAARKAAQEVVASLETPLFALLFDCVSRWYFLREEFARELEGIQKALGQVPLCGFLSAGEIRPYGRAPVFRNKTVVVACAGKGKKEHPLTPPQDVPPEAELAILHEIAAMPFDADERFFQEIVERAVRLFGVQRMALLFQGREVLFGFPSVEAVEEAVRHSRESLWVAPIDLGGEEGLLILEAPFPPGRRERRLYTLFARKIEEILRFIRRSEEREQRIQELEHLSFTDELTGLYNRRGFLALAEHALLQAKREGADIGVLFLDLDSLKWINDRFGHEVGDEALQEFSGIVQKVLRKSDVLARIGGDEFVVLLKGAKEGELRRVLSRLEDAVREWNARALCPYRLSFSAGWVSLPAQEVQSVQELLAFADARMYQEKRAKKGDSFTAS